MLDRNCLAYLFSVTGWELCREQRDPLLKPEANSDEANSLTTLLAPGSESSACEWCISTPTTMLVSNTQSIFTFTNCPITPFKAMPHSPTPLQHFFILEEDKKSFQEAPPDDFPVCLIGLNWITCPWWDRNSCSGQWMTKENGISRLSFDLWWFIPWACGRGYLL